MVTEESGATPQFLAQIGTEIRRRRRDRGLTVQQLADLAGVSRRMLTQIELGQANPSLVTVDKLARPLETDFASLVRAHGAATSYEVHQAGATPGIWSSSKGSLARLAVATTQQPPAELWDWVLQPGDRYDALPDRAGSEELFLVIEGHLTITVEDGTALELDAGASARIRSDRRYCYLNRTDRPTRFVRVVHTTA